MSKELDLFDGWDSEEEDFFAMEKQQAGLQEESEKELEDSEKEKKEEEEEEDFFKELETQEDVEVEESKEGKSALATLLKEKGFIEEDFEDGLSDEDIFDKMIETRFKETIDLLPEKNKELMGFLLTGGDVESYLKNLQTSVPTELSLDSDIEDEEVQEMAARTALKKKGFDEDLIEEQIELLKNNGKIENFAKKEFEIWKEEKKKALANAKTQQDEARAKDKETEKQNIESVKQLLEDKESFKNLSLKKEVKENLPDYIYKKNVTLSNGVKISEMQKDLFYEINKNPKTLIQIATLLKNRKEDGTVDFSFLQRKAETKIVKEVKDNIRRIETTKEKTGFDRGFLADLFN